MAANSTEILHDFPPIIRIYKDGRVERLTGEDIVPASVDFETGVQSKDILISPEFDISTEANVVVVSVGYRLAPEHPLPIAYEDSWLALKWVASQSTGDGHEPWIQENVYFDHVDYTTVVAEEKIRLERAESTILMASGMCVSTVMLMALVPASGHIVTTTDCYRRTRIFIETVRPKWESQYNLFVPINLST